MDASASCFHCGQVLPRLGAVADADADAGRAYCCAGCAAAAAWIGAAGLDDYYRVRARPAARVPERAPDYAAWNAAALGPALSRRDDGCAEATVLLEGLRCAACAWLVERVLAREPGVAQVAVDVPGARLTVAWREGEAELPALLRTLARLGYVAWLPSGPGTQALRDERRTAMKRLGVAGLGAMQAMMASEALYFGGADVDPAVRDFFRLISLAIATPVVFYAGWPFLRGAWREVRMRRPGMDLLVGLSIALAWSLSAVETLRGGPAVWFDSAVMFVLFLLSARELERALRRRAGAAVEVLARAQPALALRLDPDGECMVDAASLGAGDRVRVRPGEAVPADGRVASVAAELDESLLTGESSATVRRAGDAVIAGSVCLGAPFELRVERAGPATVVAQLARLAGRAQAGRARATRLADMVAARFALAVVVLAGATAVAWWAVAPAQAVPALLAVLVVSCPCALSLAVPAALSAAHARLARRGVLLLSPDALERLTHVDTVVLDKTGTLTQGRCVVAQVTTAAGWSRERALDIAAALERQVAHPLARAFDAVGTAYVADDVRAIAGSGVEGRVDGGRWRLGTPAFAGGGMDGDDGAVALGDGERIVARFVLEDPLRDDVPDAIRALRERGMAVELLSGDAAGPVARLAATLGLDRWRARCTPEQKLERIRALQAQGHVVAMVGDGINDAAVLAGADVSVAVAEGAALALAHADLVVHGGPAKLPAVLALAHATRRTIRQNLAWAVTYNAAALPAAALGLVAPWLAALGMSASSLVVTLNAARLAREGRPRPDAAPRTAQACEPVLGDTA